MAVMSKATLKKKLETTKHHVEAMAAVGQAVNETRGMEEQTRATAVNDVRVKHLRATKREAGEDATEAVLDGLFQTASAHGREFMERLGRRLLEAATRPTTHSLRARMEIQKRSPAGAGK